VPCRDESAGVLADRFDGDELDQRIGVGHFGFQPVDPVAGDCDQRGLVGQHGLPDERRQSVEPLVLVTIEEGPMDESGHEGPAYAGRQLAFVISPACAGG
jgi:hypothetical protein